MDQDFSKYDLSRRVKRRKATAAMVMAAAAVVYQEHRAVAADVTFTFATTGTQAWTTPGNWIGGVLPGPNDDAVIAGGTSSMSFGSGSSLTTQYVLFSDPNDRSLRVNTSTATNGTLTLNGASGSPGTPLISVTSSNTFTMTGNVGSGAGSLDVVMTASGTFNASSGGTLSMSTILSESGTGGYRLTKTGAGTLSFTTGFTNTTTGGITAAGGNIKFFSPSQFGATPASVVSNYITFDGGTLSFSSLSGNTGKSNEGYYISANNGTFETVSLNTYDTFAVISGPGGLTKQGAGSLTLDTANTFLGGLTVAAGIVNFSAPNNLGDVSGTVTDNGGVLRYTGTGTTLEANRSIVMGANGGTIDVNNAVTSSLTVSSTVSGAGALTKTGVGTLYLSNSANSFTGGLTVSGGTVSFFNGHQLGPVPSPGSPTFLTLNGGAISYTSGSAGYTQDVADGFTLGANSGTIGVANAQTYTVNGTVSGTGSLTKTGIGTLALLGNNSYTGGTTITAGTVSVDSGVSLGSSLAVNPVILAGGALNFVGNISSAPLATNRTTYLGNTAAASTGTIGVGAGFLVRTAAPIIDSTMAGGVGALVKTGAGTFIVQASSTYSGGTKVLAGALLVNSASTSPLGTGSVTIGDGTTTNAGTFGGSGTIANDVAISSNSTLAPTTYAYVTATGSTFTPGTLTISSHNLTLASGSTFIEKLGASTNDIVSMTGGGGITIGDGSTATTINLVLVDAGVGGTPSNAQYVIAQTDTGTIQNFANLSVNITSASPTLDPTAFYVTETAGDIFLNVPEPTAGTLVLGGLGMMLARRRRSKAI